jgi:hypothetical protein
LQEGGTADITLVSKAFPVVGCQRVRPVDRSAIDQRLFS